MVSDELAKPVSHGLGGLGGIGVAGQVQLLKVRLSLAAVGAEDRPESHAVAIGIGMGAQGQGAASFE